MESSSLPLLYACIAYESNILVEYAPSGLSKHSSLAQLVLPRIEHATSQKLTYTHGSHHIHYLAESTADHASHTSAGSLTFLAISESSLGRRIPFGFLTELRTRFFEALPENSTNYSELPFYGAAGFTSDLQSLLKAYSEPQAGGGGPDDAITNAQREIDDVRGIMSQNIEGLLERGERMDLLVDRTERLGGNAREFRYRSRELTRRMWWKNVKLMALMGVGGLIILLTIINSFRS